jgi:S1-C subfamily serine protease
LSVERPLRKPPLASRSSGNGTRTFANRHWWIIGLILLTSSSILWLLWFVSFAQAKDLRHEIQSLRDEVSSLKQEQKIPSLALTRYRNSVCYLVGTYRITFPHKPPARRTRISGTGFVVDTGLVATNRHVAQPWYKDADSEALIRLGAVPSLENLVAYFPGVASPVPVKTVALSRTDDLALVRMHDAPELNLEALPLSSGEPGAGDAVAVVGYPMGVLGMMAKSPNEVYAHLASRHDSQNSARELATLSLIRPSATFGHLGDIIGGKLVYDAPTAKGASGGPVFNSHGEVIAVNQGYIDGFSGGTLGVSSEGLKQLISQAKESKAQSE